MPITYLAAQRNLDWADYVATVGLFQRNGEPTGGLYARQPVTFSPVSNGSRLSREVITFELTGQHTIYYYALFDGAGNILAYMPHCSSADTNPPQPCFFIDTANSWIDAPGHTLSVGQNIVLIDGQDLRTNTQLDAQYNPLVRDGVQYYTLPPSFQANGPFYPWYVSEVADGQFRLELYEDYPYGVRIFGSYGWGFYQRIDAAVFPNGGTLQINSIRLTEFG